VELKAGSTVIADRYLLLRKRGTGGVGSVWLARDLSLDSLCALKLIDVGRADHEELCLRLEREAKSTAQLRCSNVVDVFDHGVCNGVPYLVMEFLDGEDLGECLTRLGRIAPERTYRIVAQVARALARAHGLGIVHRDLKPDNIFLVPGDEHEVAKVLDFGIARHEQYSGSSKATKTGTFVGTPSYVSPEQARGEDVDWRTDLWALGIIVFECLTGKPPFMSAGLGELMAMILYEPIPRLRDRVPELPPGIEVWWERASDRDPRTRFQSAKELADALAAALGIESPLPIPEIAPLQHGRAPSPRVAPPVHRIAARSGGIAARSGGIAARSGEPTVNSASVELRRHLKHEHWFLPIGAAAVLAVVAISAISAARSHRAHPVEPATKLGAMAIPPLAPPPPALPVTVARDGGPDAANDAAPDAQPVRLEPPRRAAREPSPRRERENRRRTQSFEYPDIEYPVPTPPAPSARDPQTDRSNSENTPDYGI
jgi:serine/threonine protein kinase